MKKLGLWFWHHKAVPILIFVFLYLFALLFPYAIQGGVSEAVKEAFELSDYYGDTAGADRAQVLYTNEEALTERLRLIEQAEDRIILSTFEFRADNSGKKMLAALYAAAERGVEIQILIDGFSAVTNYSERAYFTALGSLDGVTIKIYNPLNLLQPQKIMARLHDKYLIVDDEAYILGGRNTYDYFLGTETSYINYDWDVLVWHADADAESSLDTLKAYFETVWALDDCKVRYSTSSPGEKVTDAAEELQELYLTMKEEHPDWFAETDYTETTVAVNQITLLSNPIEVGYKEPVLFYDMTELMMEAEGAVIFHTPYIMCSSYMMSRLQLLCDTKEEVTMLTNSVANNGNPFGASDYRSRRDQILATGLSVLEYDSGVSYHGKCFTIGDRLTAIGSFNWDMRSAYLDTELMLVIDSEELNAQMREYMESYESAALTVNADGTFALKEGQTASELTFRRALRINLIFPFLWLRFVM